MAESLNEGIRLYRIRRYAEALTCFLSLPTASSEQNIELAYYIGLCYARLERYDDALLYLEQVVTSGDDLGRIYQCRLMLAVIYTLTGRIRLADFELHKLLDCGYESCQVFSALAFTAWEQERFDDAVEWYEKALGLDGDNATALNGLGYVLACTNKDLTKALTLCKRAVEAQPDSAACLDSLGWVYFKLGLKKEAQAFSRRAREKNPDNPEIASHFRQINMQVTDDYENGRLSASGGR